MMNQKFVHLVNLIKKAKGYRTINQFASDCSILNSNYIVSVLNGDIPDFPTEQFLAKIALGAENGVTLNDLKRACGYSTEMTNEELRNVWIGRAEIYFADLGDTLDSEQGGHRPFLILQNNIGNRYSSTTVGIPLTSKFKKMQPTQVKLGYECSLPTESIAMTEQIRCISKRRLLSDGYPQRIGKCPPRLLRQVEGAILKELGLVHAYADDKIINKALDYLAKTMQTQLEYDYEEKPAYAV